MKIKILCLLLSGLFITSNPAISQGTSDNTKFTVEKVTIINPGKIQTDLYTLVTEVRDYLHSQVSIDKNVVIFNAIPDAWEGEMKNIDIKNKANWPYIQKYHAWHIATSPKYEVLEIKPEENTDMPEGFKPTENFYIVIEPSGIAKIKDQSVTNNSNDNCSLVISIYDAAKTKFSGIKGKLLPSGNYEAKLPVAGAENIYIKDVFGWNELVAEFGTYTSLSKANEQFSTVAENFKSCSNCDVKKISSEENMYEIVPKGQSPFPSMKLLIKKNKDQFMIILSFFLF